MCYTYELLLMGYILEYMGNSLILVKVESFLLFYCFSFLLEHILFHTIKIRALPLVRPVRALIIHGELFLFLNMASKSQPRYETKSFFLVLVLSIPLLFFFSFFSPILLYFWVKSTKLP